MPGIPKVLSGHGCMGCPPQILMWAEALQGNISKTNQISAFLMEEVQVTDSNKNIPTGNCTIKQTTAKIFVNYGLCKN